MVLEKLLVLSGVARERAIPSSAEDGCGAAMLDSNGHTWTAASVSTKDRVVGACAERTALFYALTNGARRITHIAISVPDRSRMMHPCGDCLEAIKRFAATAEIIISRPGGASRVFSIEDLLPSGKR